jgi:acyl-CoA thioesterase-1
MDSSVLLPEPDAPTMATDSRARQREIDVMQNGQHAGGVGHLLGDALNEMMGSDMREGFFGCGRGAVPGGTVARRAAGRGGAGGNRRCTGGKARALLVVGDSLSAEYGLARGRAGWPCWSSAWREKLPWQVVNASISGDTTSGGRSRLPALLQQHKPRVVVIELGGNDALRGLPLAMTAGQPGAMAALAKAAGARVLIAGHAGAAQLRAQAYGEDFNALFGSVAKAEHVALVPFLLWPAWPTRRTRTRCSSPTASTPGPRPTRACWTTSGPCCGRCCGPDRTASRRCQRRLSRSRLCRLSGCDLRPGSGAWPGSCSGPR